MSLFFVTNRVWINSPCTLRHNKYTKLVTSKKDNKYVYTNSRRKSKFHSRNSAGMYGLGQRILSRWLLSKVNMSFMYCDKCSALRDTDFDIDCICEEEETEDLNEEKEQRAERENHEIESHLYPSE